MKETKLLKCLTINTDASFYPDHKVGGWACYIICDEFKIKSSGQLKIHPEDSIDAEMMAMANAIAILLKKETLPAVKLIVINSDCLRAFPKIGLKKQGTGRTVAKLLKKLRERTSFNSVVLPKYEFRHVKAHNGTPDSRSWVNDWCDKEAKKQAKLLHISFSQST